MKKQGWKMGYFKHGKRGLRHLEVSGCFTPEGLGYTTVSNTIFKAFLRQWGLLLTQFFECDKKKHGQTSENSVSQRIVPGYEPRQKGRGSSKKKRIVLPLLIFSKCFRRIGPKAERDTQNLFCWKPQKRLIRF